MNNEKLKEIIREYESIPDESGQESIFLHEAINDFKSLLNPECKHESKKLFYSYKMENEPFVHEKYRCNLCDEIIETHS